MENFIICAVRHTIIITYYAAIALNSIFSGSHCIADDGLEGFDMEKVVIAWCG